MQIPGPDSTSRARTGQPRFAYALAPQTSDWLMLIIRAKPGEVKAALDQVEEVLRRRRKLPANAETNFDLSTADRIIEQFDSITAGVGLVAIAAHHPEEGLYRRHGGG